MISYQQSPPQADAPTAQAESRKLKAATAEWRGAAFGGKSR